MNLLQQLRKNLVQPGGGQDPSEFIDMTQPEDSPDGGDQTLPGSTDDPENELEGTEADRADIVDLEDSVNRDYYLTGDDSKLTAPYLNNQDLENAEPELEDASFEPESKVAKELQEHLANLPNRDDPKNKPSFWRRLAAGIIGGAQGFQGDVEGGRRTVKAIVGDPFRKHMQDWKLRGDALTQSAAQENKLNQILARLSSEKERRNTIKQTKEMQFLRNLSTQRGISSRFTEAERTRGIRADEVRKSKESSREDIDLNRSSRESIADKNRKSREEIAQNKRESQELRPRGTSKSGKVDKKTNEQRKAIRTQALTIFAKDPKWAKFFESDNNTTETSGILSRITGRQKKKIRTDKKGNPVLNLNNATPAEWAEIEQALDLEIKRIGGE